MVMHQHIDTLKAEIVPAAQIQQLRRNRAERAFDLPPVLFGMTVGAYFAFLGVMGAVFMNPELIIPFAIFGSYIVMAFGVPGLWAKMRPEQPGRVQSWAEFMREGIATGSGHLGGGAAVAQVMTLPALILAWGVAIAIIRITV